MNLLARTRKHLKLTINGVPWEGDVVTNLTLLDFIRDSVQLTGAKKE